MIHILEPLITHSSPSRTARVRMPATSEPWSGSLTAMEATISPRIAGARYCSFCSWVPKRASDGVAMSTCTPSAIGSAPWSQRPNSSARMTVNMCSAPCPPYSGSYSSPSIPSVAIFEKMSCSGIIPAASHPSMCGLISLSTNSRTIARKAWCSSVINMASSPGRGPWRSGVAPILTSRVRADRIGRCALRSLRDGPAQVIVDVVCHLEYRPP